jgi:hypothetical protein
MLETLAGATEPAEVLAFLPGGGPPRYAKAALTRQQRRLVDRVNLKDARWFLAHPAERRRVRPIVRGEFAPLVEDRAWTTVVVIRHGDQRIRLPYSAAGAPPPPRKREEAA